MLNYFFNKLKLIFFYESTTHGILIVLLNFIQERCVLLVATLKAHRLFLRKIVFGLQIILFTTFSENKI